MHSRYARNLYNPKIEIIFGIARTNFEITLFIHFYPPKSAIWRSKGHFTDKFYNWLSLPLQMKSIGPKKIWFSWIGVKVPYQHFWKIAKMALFYLCMEIKNFLDQTYSFDVVNISPLWFFSLSVSTSVHVLI